MKRGWLWGGVGVAVVAASVMAWQTLASDVSGLEEARGQLAVLDRPPTANDRGPEAKSVLRFLRETGREGVHEDSVRLLRRGDDEEATILVAIGQIEETTPAHPGDEVPTEGLCLFVGGMLMNETCGHLDALRSGAIGGAAGEPVISEAGAEDLGKPRSTSGTIDRSEVPETPPGTPWHFYGLVPDGVARVVQTFSGAVPDATATVSNNFYDAVSSHPEASDRNGPIRWYDDAGRLIRTTH